MMKCVQHPKTGCSRVERGLHCFRLNFGGCTQRPFAGQSVDSKGFAARSDAAVLEETGAIAPRILLAVARARLFARLVRTAPVELLTVIAEAAKASRSWQAAIREDLGLLAKSEVFSKMHGANIPAWWRRAREFPRAFRRDLVKAAADATISEVREWTTTSSQKQLGQRF